MDLRPEAKQTLRATLSQHENEMVKRVETCNPGYKRQMCLMINDKLLFFENICTSCQCHLRDWILVLVFSLASHIQDFFRFSHLLMILWAVNSEVSKFPANVCVKTLFLNCKSTRSKPLSIIAHERLTILYPIIILLTSLTVEF